MTSYDADNRVSSQQAAYDPSDPTYNTPPVTSYTYNAAGRLKVVTAPSSGLPASGGPNVTKYVYFDNNWVKSSTDPWNITTNYDYTDNGQQKTRQIVSADGAMKRTMTWGYYPGRQLASLTDDGVPTGLYSQMADNSDFNNATSTGTWATATTGSGYAGYNYRTHAAGAGTDTFTWNLNIPADGNYTVYVKYPVVSGAATNASFKVFYNGGSATVAVNQTTNNSNGWVSLGKFAFTQSGAGQKVTLTQNSGGIVVADAVEAVRDTTGINNTAHHDFAYTYDPNANLTGIADNSTTSPAIASYAMTYDGIDRLTQVQEKDSSGAVQHTTSYGYDADGNLTSRTHDSAPSTYTYDPRNLLARETDATSASDPSPQVTTFGYNPLGLRASQGKPNGNTVTYGYFADGLLAHQLETTPAGATVAEHTYTYNPDGHKLTDAGKVMNADSTTAYLTHTLAYSYDPRDRLTQVATDGATTESYTHDATGNVTDQTISNTRTIFSYDRDRLLTAVTGGSTASYNYDPLGRLDTVTSGATQVQANTYDGFDHIAAHTQLNSSGTGTDTTTYTYDPLGRQTSQAVNGGTPTQFNYLGLSSGLVTETSGGSVTKSYTYTPAGERISQASHNPDGTTTPGYYTYNDHSDVEAVTGSSGTTTSTYGYTAYGQPVASQFTGADKNNASPGPTAKPASAYRFNAMRWDSATGQYDMGFRTYAPSLNQFLTRDMYDGALADMSLTTDPFTGNRYTFGAGNPVSNIELDGHMFPGAGGAAGCPYGTPGCPGSQATSSSPAAQGCSAPTQQRYTGCNPTLPPPSFIGGAPSFLAGIGGSFVGLLDFATTASNPSQGMKNMATGHTYSDAYTGWLHRHGVPTGLNSEYGAGFGTGAALQAAAGLFTGAGEASATADIAAPEEVVPVLRYPGLSLPRTAQNMARYMNDNALDATSTFVRVDAKVAAANRAANRLLYQGGPSMEEFPFASTAQGGPGAYLTQVSIQEQRAQGLLLANFYRANGINPGDPFAIWIDWTH